MVVHAAMSESGFVALGLGENASEPGDGVSSKGASDISISGMEGMSVGEGTISEGDSSGLFSEPSATSRYSSITDGPSLLLSPAPIVSMCQGISVK